MTQTELGLEVLVKVDAVCKEFESLFAQGAEPRIEDFVDRIDPAYRSALVLELVALDVELRKERGLNASADELVARYALLLPASDLREANLRSTIEKALSATRGPAVQDVADTLSCALKQPDTPAGFPRIDGFTIESVLGRGGMGIVYKAVQTFPRRPVALKMILDQRRAGDQLAEEFFQRFAKEAQAVADLNDPHFVQIYAFGEVDGRPYMALEYVDGGSLERHRRGEPQSVDFSTEMVEYLARGMDKSHRAGLVHRDLKPHNVLLTSQGVAKIADFGLVKRVDQDAQLTADGRPMGTPSYMAPEQTYGSTQVGPAADIYALGGILYCLLTGRPPFQADNWRDTFEQVCHQEPVPPSRLNPKVTRDLETICLKCLEKEPAKRYATAADLADDLRRFQEGRPIVARPISRAERAWRWARRNPWVAGLGSGVAMLIVTVAVVSSVMSWQLSLKNERITKQNLELSQKSTVISQKNEQLTVARNATQEQRNASLDVVRTVLLRVDDLLRDNTALFRLRAQLIDEALKGLDVVRDNVEENPLTDAGNPLVDRTDAIAHQRIGNMYLLGNRVTDAGKEFERAIAILRRLSADAPQDPVNVRNLAAILNARGDVELRLGNTQKARDDYQQALDLRQQWVELVPYHNDAKWSVAQSHGLLGKVSLMLGEPEQALEHFQAGQALYESLPAPTDPADALTFRRERAANEQRLGESCLQLDRAADAENHYQVALQQRQETARDEKNPPALLHDVALSRLCLGDFYLRDHNNPGKAWEQYNEALAIFLPLAKAEPTSLQRRSGVAAVQYRYGATFRRARQQHVTLPNGEQPPDPASHFEASRKLREGLAQVDPQDAQARIEWALAVARCGQAAEAEKLAQELEEQVEAKDPYVLFQVACTYALCSEAQDPELAGRCRDRAFATLEKLLHAGWKDPGALKHDPDLDPIRSDSRFAQLGAALVNKRSPEPASLEASRE